MRVYVYDKKPLEMVLGIDLLIYQSIYKSFLLIQYKAMQCSPQGTRTKWLYRVDDQILSQVAAMKSVENAIDDAKIPAIDITGWRLNTTPFFFKFCETTRPEARDESLIRGITLKVRHLEEFLSFPESRGKRDGRLIGYENCPRYLNNTQFTDLARDGWLGCGDRGFDVITRILQANRAGGRRAMLAVIDKIDTIEGERPRPAKGRLIGPITTENPWPEASTVRTLAKLGTKEGTFRTVSEMVD